MVLLIKQLCVLLELIMKIKKLTYHNKALDWYLESVEFSSFDLLVGASGVGKTQILNAILDLQKIAKGKALNGVAWEVTFSIEGIDEEIEYFWSGEFENVTTALEFEGAFILETDLLTRSSGLSPKGNQSELKPKILKEQLSSGQTTLVTRDLAEIYFKGKKLPVKLSAFESMIKLFNENENIEAIYDDFVYRISLEWGAAYVSNSAFLELLENYKTFEAIQNINLDTINKLLLVYYNVPQVFNDIKHDFIDIFPQVEDITVKRRKTKIWSGGGEVENEVENGFVFFIKEKGLKNWISEFRLSAGMYKSLRFIANLYLSAPGTVILVDEFENSLGVNCIDVVNNLLIERRDLQYIITSHHPYIINKIPMAHWKIVTRQGSFVKVKKANDFRLGNSKHEAFMQLLQLEEFSEGIVA